MICIKCGAQMNQTDKNTMSGRVIREYECRSCGHFDWADEGVALWKLMQSGREADRVEAAARAQAAQPAAVSPSRNPRPSLWQRLASLFRGR